MGQLHALKLKTEPTPLQRARRRGAGNRTPAEVREAEGTKPRASRQAGVNVAEPHKLETVGSPPSRWNGALKAAWRGLRSEVPWLRRPDRKLVIRYCRLHVAHEAAYVAWERAEGDAADKHWKVWMDTGDKLFRIEQKLGMSPSDRTRVLPVT